MWTVSGRFPAGPARGRGRAATVARRTAAGALLGLAGVLLATGGAAPAGWVAGAGALAAQEHELRQWDVLRVTGATVHRGGPASPPRLLPVAMEGRVAGMRGDTLLFETEDEPIYWIPLSVGPPLVERRAQVTDRTRLMLVASAVAGAAGATFAWGLHDGCGDRPSTLASACDAGGSGRAALQGFAAGVAVGAAAGLVLSRFAKRWGWVPMPADAIRYSPWPTTGDRRPQLGLRR